jgi:hypothetical protein
MKCRQPSFPEHSQKGNGKTPQEFRLLNIRESGEQKSTNAASKTKTPAEGEKTRIFGSIERGRRSKNACA